MNASADGRTPHLLRRAGHTLAQYVSAQTALVLTASIGGLLVLVLVAASAGVYDAVAEQDGVAALDRPVLDAAISRRTATADWVITAFTHLGGPVGMPIIAGAVTALLVWRWRSWTPLVLMVVAVTGSLTFTTVGKALVGRARPPLTDAVPPYEQAFSFPSGHTLNSTVIAGLVAYLVILRVQSRIARVVCVLAAVGWSAAMGLSRVFLGHHWFTDVMFAWFLGLAWLALVISAHRVFLTVRSTRRAS